MRERVPLRDTALAGIDPADRRHIEVVVTGLPMFHGTPVAVDATLISPLHADGTAWAGAAERSGASFARAESVKAVTYPELVDSSVLRLVTTAAEIGGRLNRQSLDLLDAAAAGKAAEEPPVLRRQAARAWRARWVTMLSVAIQDATAATLVAEGARFLDAAEGATPTAVDVWLDAARSPDGGSAA